MIFKRRLVFVVICIAMFSLVSTEFMIEKVDAVSETVPEKNFHIEEAKSDVQERSTSEKILKLQSIDKIANTEERATEEVVLGKKFELVEKVLESEFAEEMSGFKKWDGPVLNAVNGVVQGPSGKETYYNLDMSGVIRIMKNCGYDYEYWVREDGVKMFGPYVMCAANLELRPRGTILETSLGTAIVCDTGGFAEIDPTQVDIAVDW